MEKAKIPIHKSESDIRSPEDFFNMQWIDLNIESLEKIESPHRHDYYSIYFLVSGETLQFIDFHEYKVQANALIVMRPEQIHFHVRATNAKLLRIKFKEQFLLRFQIGRHNWQDIFSTDVIQVDEASMKNFLSFIQLLEAEINSDLESKDIQAKLFSALLDKISLFMNMDESPNSSKYTSIYKRFKQLVIQHALSEVKVTDYAKRLFLSAGHLNDVVKEVTGKNAKHIINEQRILEAKRLLYWTDVPIGEVAYKTGFEDPAYFTRFFKKYTGLLPSEFQKKL
ncbi:helix-turn-helix domain-containing protein [Albibacterium indicum]|uniref:helix-turn-helix domain-containing protein n=1 Tax=Albibacterium indicum TaxID=2292082 RepID=UPI000E500795|nr:helix-turn-helix domain-containing protein [Pedobacter indicus]